MTVTIVISIIVAAFIALAIYIITQLSILRTVPNDVPIPDNVSDVPQSDSHEASSATITKCPKCGMAAQNRCPQCGTYLVDPPKTNSERVQYNIMREQFNQSRYQRTIYAIIIAELIAAIIAGIICVIVYNNLLSALSTL